MFCAGAQETFGLRPVGAIQDTGEVVETKGGNHKNLKEWKAVHGSTSH
jgi:hypothetical protein